jgi:hypothetical protein
MTSSIIIVGLLTPLAISAASVPQPGEIRIFKDWAVGCDNRGTCKAVSLVPDDGGASYDQWAGPITLLRTADGSDILKIRALFPAKDIDRYVMTVDGKRVDTGRVVDGDYPIEIVGEDAKKVAAAIVNGNQLVITGPNDSHLTQISLAGSSAALRYLDMQQNRAGTQSALVAQGRRAFEPRKSNIPVIAVDQWEASQRTPEADDIVEFVESSKCKDDRYGVVEDQAYPLGKRGNIYRALVTISCGSGAYNFSSAPYIAEYVENEQSATGWTFTAAKFDRQPSWGGEGTDPLLVNASWDERDQTLSSYGKGRGLGDCGSAENYIWDGEMFRLMDASAMPECRGAYDWITTWQAKYRKIEQTAATE